MLKKTFLKIVITTALMIPAVGYSAVYHGVDIYSHYRGTFGHWVTSSGRTYDFPVMSQIEKGKKFSGPGLYNYVPDGNRGSYKTNLSRACGPMSLLMGADWYAFTHDSNKSNDYLRTKVAAVRATASIYANVNTDFEELQDMAAAVGYTFYQTDEDLSDENTYNNGNEFLPNDASRINMMKAIVDHVHAGRHVIPLWVANSPANMTGVYTHFGLIYRIVEYPGNSFVYGNQLVTHGYVHFLDPWTGQRIIRSKRQVMDSFDLVNGGSYDYLVVKK